MAAIDVTPGLVRPLHGAIIRRYEADAALDVGDAVYINGDGEIAQADNAAVGTAQGRGIVVGVGVSGATAAAAGNWCDVVTHGPVELGNATGMTEGGVAYVGGTAGTMDQTASATPGEFNYIMGFAEAPTVFYVDPQMVIPTEVPA